MKKLAVFVVFILLIAQSLAAQDLTGFWQTIDKKTKQPSSVIAIYLYNGKYYGKIVATCNQQGVVCETIERPQSKAPGVIGNPFYCGLDIIWGCAPDGNGVYKGYVVDPQEGKRYTAKIWKEKENLILRGELLMFGSNEVLIRFPESSFNQSFAKPNVASFTPAAFRIKG